MIFIQSFRIPWYAGIWFMITGGIVMRLSLLSLG